MKKLYFAALISTILGLAGGLFYREFTKAHDFTGYTQLAVVHTHLLVLGTLVMLIALVMEKVFSLSKTKWFNLFFWHYIAGLAITITSMTIHGILTILNQPSSKMLDGISGLGHLVLGVALMFFFVALYKQIFQKRIV